MIEHEGACLQVQPTMIEGKEKIKLPNPAIYMSKSILIALTKSFVFGLENNKKDNFHNREITTSPKEHICKPRVCIKSVNVLPSTGESSREPKSAT